MTVPEVLAENMAIENYINVKRIDSEMLLKLREKLKKDLEFVGSR